MDKTVNINNMDNQSTKRIISIDSENLWRKMVNN